MRLLTLLLPFALSAQDYNAKVYEDFPFVEGFENLWTTYDRVMVEQDDNDWARVFFYEKCSAVSYVFIQGGSMDVWSVGDGFRGMALGTRALYAIENDEMLDGEKNAEHVDDNIIFYGGEYLVYEEDWGTENKIEELENPEPHQLYSDYFKEDLQFCLALRENLLARGVDITQEGMGVEK